MACNLSDILDYISTLLGGLITTPIAAAKGLLRLSIKDAFPDKEDANDLRLEDFHAVFDTALRTRLERVKFKKVDDIIAKLHSSLASNQSLLTMMRV
jgi:N-formylglutamate amidohydrolase